MRVFGLVGLTASLLALAAAGAALGKASGASADNANAVFVQTNDPSGNRIAIYDRSADGRLTFAATYATGGNGGVALPGTESDHLASQGSLVYDGGHKLLIAVNAGSDTVSSFRVQGDRLELRSVVSSGGQFPASVSVHDNIAYVLNSGGTGIVQGFRVDANGLRPIPGSARTLGLANTDPPFFLTSPGQVGFTPDGRQLIVTTKASGSLIDLFQVQPGGTLAPTPVRNPSATPVPFAFTFTPSNRLAAGEAGLSAVSTYALSSDGSLTDPKSLSDGEAALCWIQRAGDFYYVANTGSDTLSGYRIGPDGQPTLIGATGIVAVTESGPIDLTSPNDSHFLYGENGISGTVDEYRVNDDGTLTKLGVVTGLPPGLEGIASS
jgi:6-phosphogluconolactonase (cycloisomerase 2 family)